MPDQGTRSLRLCAFARGYSALPPPLGTTRRVAEAVTEDLLNLVDQAFPVSHRLVPGQAGMLLVDTLPVTVVLAFGLPATWRQRVHRQYQPERVDALIEEHAYPVFYCNPESVRLENRA